MSLLRRRMMMQEAKGVKNLIDKSKLIYGLLDTKTAEVDTSRKDWMATDFIPIDGTDNYEMGGFTRLRYFVGDTEKNYINQWTADSFVTSRLINGAYVRFTFPVTDAETIIFRHLKET